ncbi:MAG: ribosome maturation factor RimM [Actinomycetota bacterium]
MAGPGGPASGPTPPPADPPPVLVGEITRAHGIKGEVAVTVFSEHPSRFAPGAEVWVGSGPGDLRPARVVRSRTLPGHAGRVILLLDETLDRTMAEALRGCLLFAGPEDEGELGEDAWWERDLVGLEVRDTAGNLLGTLTGVLTRPAQDLWEMEGPNGPVLIPATRAIVRSVDVAGGVVTVDPPPGLL